MAPDPQTMTTGQALASAKAVCIVVHGRGQSPQEMEAHILRRLAAPEVAFVLPAAATKSWYAARAVDPLTDATRAELGAALAQLGAQVAAIRAATAAPILLAGFSQGACLSIEYMMAGGAEVAALAAFTGCRVGTPACARPAADLPGLPAYLSGSDADPWIPVHAFAEAAGALATARTALTAQSFPGRGHEVSDAEIVVLRRMLDALAERTAA